MLRNLELFHRPTSLPEAVALLKKNPDAVVPLAGGTHLVPSDAREVTEVVDITHLGLNFIGQDKTALRIGATTTLQEVIDSEVIRDLAQGILVEACRATTVSRMRRIVSTIGGEIVVAAPRSGVPVALLALDARLKVVDDKERQVALSDFYLGEPQQLRGAIITEVIVPMPSPNTRAAFLRLAQIPSSIPIIQIATLVELEQGVCQRARIAIGAATARPTRFSSAEARLVGHTLDAQTIKTAAEDVAVSINPISDTRGSAEYRCQMSRVFARRALLSVVSSP